MQYSYFMKPLTIVIYVLIIGVLGRLWLVADLPLSGDEAHYALYAYHLDWSYFDHPPLIGWLQYLAFALLGEEDWVFRVMPNLIHIGIGLLLFCLTQKLYQQHKQVQIMALLSVCLFEATLMFQLMGITMLPDNPLMLFMLLSFFCFDRAYRTNQWLAWIGYGICLGLMGLSKYTAILIALGYGLFILFSHPILFLNYRLWVAALIGIICISPVIYWNIEHHWISFSYQMTHSNMQANSASLLAWLRSQGINLLTYGFFLFITLWWVIIFAMKTCWGYVKCSFNKPIVSVHTISQGVNLSTLLRWIMVIYFAVFSYSAAQGGHYLPHWVAVIFLLCLPNLSSLLMGCYVRLHSWKTRLYWQGISYVMVFVTLVAPFVLTILLLSGKLADNLTYEVWRGVVGWKESAQIAKKLIQQDGKLSEDSVIYVANWSEASRLAWYARPIPVIPVDGDIGQYDLWFNQSIDIAGDRHEVVKYKGVLVAHMNHDELEEVKSSFTQCHLAKKLTYYQHNLPFVFGVWRCDP